MGNKISLTEILMSNGKFYHAFAGLSIDMMDNLWKHDENIICVHPGWDLLVVVCQENIESSVRQQDKIGIIATNIFERYEN